MAAYSARCATAIHIRQPFTDTLWCSGGSAVGIHYTLTTLFSPGNVFTVQLSDASGNFSSGSIIGFNTATDTGTIICYLNGIPAGNNYRVRVIGNLPADTSLDNGVNIHIGTFPPTPVVSNNSPQCAGAKISMAVTNIWPNTIYYWQGPGFNGYAKQVDFNNVNFPKAGGYTITATDTTTPSKCMTASTTVVNVKPIPQDPAAQPVAAACSGNSMTLSATTTPMVPQYSWTGPMSFNAVQPPNVVIYNITAAQGGYYYVRSLDNGCYSKNADSVWVDVIQRPQLVLNTNSPLCTGDDLHLSAHDTGSISYSWQGPNSFQSVQPDITIPKITSDKEGNYIVTASYMGCITKDTITVKVKPLPPKLKLLSNSPVCEGDDLKIILPVEDSIPDLALFLSGPDNFETSDDTTVIKNVTSSAGGNYFLTTYLQGCTTSDTTVVTIKPAPVIKASSNSPVPEDGQLKLFAEIGTQGAIFNWKGPDGFSSAEQNPVIEKASLNDSGVYTLYAIFDGCTGTDVITVDVYDRAKYTLFGLRPNPNNGEFILKGHLLGPQQVDFEVCNISGMVLGTGSIVSHSKAFEEKISLPAHLINGLYILRIHADGEMHALKFSIMR